MKKVKAILHLLTLTFVLASFMGCKASEPEAVGDEPQMRDITTSELVLDMGLGINLGNTLEACGSWIGGSTVQAYETAWGSPIITEEMVAGYAEAGFSSVRVPVAWSNLMSKDGYIINADLMNRVEQVVNYVLDNGMYAIVNIHWDNGWFEKFSTEYDECIKKYKSIWTQISDRFKDYNDYLIFESLNEEGCFNDIWNRYSGSDNGKAEAYGILNNINQEFVDLVRASGSNNAERHLLIAGYATDIALTCDPSYKMPNDPKNRCAVSVHYYTPATFAILEKDASWGKARATWGTEADIKELNDNMDLLKKTFVDNGIPVILGEYGAEKKNKTEEMVRLYLTTVCEAVFKRGMCPVLWDTTGTAYDRSTCKMIDPLLESEYRRIAATER